MKTKKLDYAVIAVIIGGFLWTVYTGFLMIK